MEAVTKAEIGRKQSRGFILGNISFGHGISHMFDQGFPFLMPSIAAALGLNTVHTATLFAVRQGGSSVTSLGGGPLVDMMKSQWGLILTACMFLHAISFALIAGSPVFAVLVVGVLLVSMPGSLWHLPSSAALSQRFPDRRGFAMSIQGFGANVGNALGPIVAGALLGVGFLIWKHIFFIYAAIALVMAVFVWWSLKDVGRDGEQQRQGKLKARFDTALVLMKHPIVLGLIMAALLRGIGLNALFHWTPFYLQDTLGMGSIQSGIYYALLTGMGIVSAPILGTLSDKYGRKAVLVPGFIVAAILSMLVVSAGSSFWLVLILAGMGLFSFALHQIIQASVLDVVGQGTEATAIGLLFGINGIIGMATPFLASVIIDNLGGFGAIYYYAGILTALATVIVIMLPIRSTKAPV